jgi:hypothetical protein
MDYCKETTFYFVVCRCSVVLVVRGGRIGEMNDDDVNNTTRRRRRVDDDGR